ncbi:MAG: hypothetical protein ACYTE6_06360, partial [Planctomycetota bacterium]
MTLTKRERFDHGQPSFIKGFDSATSQAPGGVDMPCEVHRAPAARYQHAYRGNVNDARILLNLRRLP